LISSFGIVPAGIPARTNGMAMKIRIQAPGNPAISPLDIGSECCEHFSTSKL
jgi:hypothetical protein